MVIVVVSGASRLMRHHRLAVRLYALTRYRSITWDHAQAPR